MALTKSFEKFGATFSEAYFRISNLTYSINEYQETTYPEPSVDEDGNPVPAEAVTEWVSLREANFTVSVFVDEDAREAHAKEITSEYHVFTPDWSSDDNVLAQAYTYLKTLDAYDGSVDA